MSFKNSEGVATIIKSEEKINSFLFVSWILSVFNIQLGKQRVFRPFFLI